MRNVMKIARILLIDEDELFRLGLRCMLEQKGMEIVGDCASAEEALSLRGVLQPNIVIMDTQLQGERPGVSGFEACYRLTRDVPDCDVIILSQSQELINYALEAGVIGYFPKELKEEELIIAIELACKRQSLRAGGDSKTYSINQIEAMIMEKMDKPMASGPEPERLSTGDNGSGLVTDEVKLVVHSLEDASLLEQFICRIGEALQASILETIGSCSDTQIMLRLQRPAPLDNILDRLLSMPEVKEASKETVVKARRFRFFKKIEAMPEKRIAVILNGQNQLSSAAGSGESELGIRSVGIAT